MKPLSPLWVVVLAAGRGTRMRSNLPKVLHPVGGRPMLAAVLETVQALTPVQTVVVASPDNQGALQRAFPDQAFCIQDQPLGTGHAVQQALPHLSGVPKGDLLVLCGDTPLIPADCLQEMRQAKAQTGSDLIVLAMGPPDLKAYGCLKLDGDGRVLEIIEAKHLDKDRTDVSNLCNSGVILMDGDRVVPLLDQLPHHAETGEYYLTDVVAMAVQAGLTCRFVEGPWQDLLGVNDRKDLANAEAQFQTQRRQHAMAQGVTLLDPASTFFSFDTIVEPDVTLHPFVTLGPGVVVERGAQVLPFSCLSDTHLGPDTKVGPFCHLRNRAVLHQGAEVGNFVEIKESTLHADSKVKHLSYVGNAQIGDRSNIGAGVVTCNYDGYTKHPTHIGQDVLLGSNTALIAPVTVGHGVVVGAGSVIVTDVPDQALALSRPEQKTINDGAKRFHQKKKGS